MPGWLRGLGASILAATLAAPVQGEPWDRLQIHGFASQAALRTSDNRFFGDSPNTSFDFTEIGVNASYRLDPRVLVSGQLLARRAGEMYDGTPSLDYALADFTLAASPLRILGVRLGRTKNELGLYNATRDMPFTRPSIFLPQVVYYDRVRNLVLSSDGVACYGSYYSEIGELALTLVGGWPVIDENVEWTFLRADRPGEMEANRIALNGSLWLTTLEERLKLGLSIAELSLKFDPSSPASLAPGTTDILYGIASIQYSAQRFTISAEYGREPVRWQDYGPFFPNRDITAEGYYLQAAYRVRPNIEVMGRYEEGFADRYDRDGKDDVLVRAGIAPPFSNFTRIATAGIRWDIAPWIMARAEYQVNHGTFVLSQRENPDSFDMAERWNVVAVQIAVRF